MGDTCFPKVPSLQKILNRNKTKLLSRKIPNFGMVIKDHKCQILRQHIKKEHENEYISRQNDKKQFRGRPKTITKKDCNCNKNTPYSLLGKCNLQDVIYQATVDLDDTYYIGQAKDSKLRYNNHQTSSHNKNLDQNCYLEVEVWKLKDWSIVIHCHLFLWYKLK